MTMGGISSLQKLHAYAWGHRDKRVDNWALMWSIYPTLFIILCYLILIKIIGPYFMKNRKPFEFKNIMQFYNAFQVGFSFWLFYYGISLGWATHYNWVCQPVEKDATPNSLPMQMAEMVWWYYFSKFTEFVDTIIFVLRKKNNQVSFLHVFHHSSMPLFSWILLRWAPGGHETFGGVINALVHVFMYSYYFLSSLGPSIAPYLWWKKYLTIMQLIQFLLVLLKSSVILLGIVDCGFPWQISLMSLSIIIPFIGLFSNFFVVEYSKRKNAYLKKNNDPNSNYLVDIKKSS
ncbi:very long chain fatty acid elongase AAEL008004 isoform X2 [Lepeophtheirus salmonis]|nr:elongation of very long chain fatty acids protein AAEL008004-like isoform X2 [Lepeophtheirus salmonis]XP_040568172.1 elongation of very long chain fatty acids protein AAEL008004-like isoform X2 [Lepeophtheirus salmonis]XP_040568173.1 elongation of very long chain fatty acids protein AAEL008004-like isoform X2 [Lepeophtheirus salmonis]XP_040568175.1 elongation of very long chain fatty acids protein AAEL008004-like isoform X2 [Lepeophtheirus salmonis]